MAGINGETDEGKIDIDPAAFKKTKAKLSTDAGHEQLLKQDDLKINSNNKITITPQPNDGFVLLE